MEEAEEQDAEAYSVSAGNDEHKGERQFKPAEEQGAVDCFVNISASSPMDTMPWFLYPILSFASSSRFSY